MNNHNQNVLRLTLFQETACYKKPVAFKVGETYPLPPYATVKGMLHHLLEADEFIPMKICIQGRFESRVVDYQSHYFFKKRNVAEFPLVMDGLPFHYEYETMTTMPMYVHLLLNVKLVIHVAAQEEILTRIEQAINAGKPISLGRWEDLVRIDECERTTLRPYAHDEAPASPYPMYFPVSVEEEVDGVPYRLNWKYTVIQGVRQWQKIKVKYIQAGQIFWNESEKIMLDDQGHPVVFAREMGEE